MAPPEIFRLDVPGWFNGWRSAPFRKPRFRKPRFCKLCANTAVGPLPKTAIVEMLQCGLRVIMSA
jgi:hypothetical protein